MTDRKQTPDVLGEILGGEILEDLDSIAQELAAVSEVRPKRTRRRRTDKPAKKQAWEYLFVSFQKHRGWRPRYVNGREVPDWMEAPIIHEYVEQLGDEGWELASASAGQEMYGLTDVRQLFFKRPKG